MFRHIFSSSLNIVCRGLKTSPVALFPERSINKIQILGRVANDPHVFIQDEQRQLVFFNVVTNEVVRRTSEDGTVEEESKPTWHSFVVRRPALRDFIVNYIVKGSRVLCHGSLQNRVKIAEDGTERKSTNIVLNDIVVVDDYRKRRTESKMDEFQEEDESIIVDQ